jgi:hypothetical protein
VPQLARPRGVFTAFDGSALEIGDDFFRPGKVTANLGETVTWRFGSFAWFTRRRWRRLSR